jgi:hypothetical protein
MDNQEFTEPPNINLLSITIDCCAHYSLWLSHNHDKKKGHFPLLTITKRKYQQKKEVKR